MSYTLLDGEARNREYPDTFEIPSEAQRTTLVAGDLVKLCFKPGGPPFEGGERMWVMVTEVVTRGRYVGSLDNDPVVIQGLDLGDRVEFEAKHVIGFMPKWPSA